MAFYSVTDDSFYWRGFPWIDRIVSGKQRASACPECGSAKTILGDIEVTLERSKGTTWPDVIGCGAYPLFIVSYRVLDDWRHEGIGELPIHKVTIVGKLPKKLEGTNPPQYFWIDGKKMRGANLDFEGSGYVGVWFCPKCGTRKEDIRATYDRRHSKTWPYKLIEETWNGLQLFTTDLSSTTFFCTGKIVESAKRNRHLNFRFVPIEEGERPGQCGIIYLGGNEGDILHSPCQDKSRR